MNTPTQRPTSAPAIGLILAAVTMLAAGCSKQPAGGPPPSAAPMEVTVLTVQPQRTELSRELAGRTSAFRVAEVRARISGIVQKRLFTEGTTVQKDQVLYEIDPAPYQAVLDSAKATLARAEATLTSTQLQATRYQGLVGTKAISQQTYDDTTARLLAAKADVAAAQAAVQSAEINLGYTRVASPIAGRIGQANVTEGAYVQQGTATLLATVQQLDTLYIDLTQSADAVLQLKEALASGRLQATAKGSAQLTVMRDNGSTYPHLGALSFSDVTVNPSTGTVLLRGTVPNPDLDLMPGMFVRARLSEGTDENSIVISQSLVTRNVRGEPVVMMVGPENKVVQRVIQTSRTVGSSWLVTGGLQPGDQVITDQLQRIRPGTPVKPVSPPAQAAPAAR